MEQVRVYCENGSNQENIATAAPANLVTTENTSNSPPVLISCTEDAFQRPPLPHVVEIYNTASASSFLTSICHVTRPSVLCSESLLSSADHMTTSPSQVMVPVHLVTTSLSHEIASDVPTVCSTVQVITSEATANEVEIGASCNLKTKKSLSKQMEIQEESISLLELLTTDDEELASLLGDPVMDDEELASLLEDPTIDGGELASLLKDPTTDDGQLASLHGDPSTEDGELDSLLEDHTADYAHGELVTSLQDGNMFDIESRSESVASNAPSSLSSWAIDVHGGYSTLDESGFDDNQDEYIILDSISDYENEAITRSDKDALNFTQKASPSIPVAKNFSARQSKKRARRRHRRQAQRNNLYAQKRIQAQKVERTQSKLATHSQSQGVVTSAHHTQRSYTNTHARGDKLQIADATNSSKQKNREHMEEVLSRVQQALGISIQAQEQFIKPRSLMSIQIPTRSDLTEFGVPPHSLVQQACTSTQQASYLPAATQQASYLPAAAQQASYLPAAAQQASYLPAAAQQASYLPAAAQQASYLPAAAQQASYLPAAAQQVSYLPAATQQASSYLDLSTATQQSLSKPRSLMSIQMPTRSCSTASRPTQQTLYLSASTKKTSYLPPANQQSMEPTPLMSIQIPTRSGPTASDASPSRPTQQASYLPAATQQSSYLPVETQQASYNMSAGTHTGPSPAIVSDRVPKASLVENPPTDKQSFASSSGTHNINHVQAQKDHNPKRNCKTNHRKPRPRRGRFQYRSQPRSSVYKASVGVRQAQVKQTTSEILSQLHQVTGSLSQQGPSNHLPSRVTPSNQLAPNEVGPSQLMATIEDGVSSFVAASQQIVESLSTLKKLIEK